MSLNSRVAVALLLALVATPLWLPFVPFAWWWLARERRRGRASGLSCLPQFMARTLSAYAEATLIVPLPAGWHRVAVNVDGYLAAVRSPRHWRTFMMLALVEFSPWLRLRPRLSRMALPARQRWVAERLSTTRGLLAVPALVRQLVRMAYYADAGVARELGFRRMRERGRGAPSRARTATFAGLAKQRAAG